MTQQNATNNAQIFPVSHTYWWGYGGKIPTGKTINFVINSMYEFGRIAVITPPAQGDFLEFQALLKAGAYQLIMLHDKYTDRAIASIYASENLLGNVDCYSSMYSYVNRSTLSLNLSTPGLHTFKVVAASKNPNSTNYNLAITAIFIYAQ